MDELPKKKPGKLKIPEFIESKHVPGYNDDPNAVAINIKPPGQPEIVTQPVIQPPVIQSPILAPAPPPPPMLPIGNDAPPPPPMLPIGNNAPPPPLLNLNEPIKFKPPITQEVPDIPPEEEIDRDDLELDITNMGEELAMNDDSVMDQSFLNQSQMTELVSE